MNRIEHEEARQDLKQIKPVYLSDRDVESIARLERYIDQEEQRDKELAVIKIHPKTIRQLESLIDNAKSFINEKDEDKEDIWHEDIEVLTNTIDVIKALLELKGINPDSLGKPRKRPDLFEVMASDES
jgi:hypothetical protein